MLLGSLPWTLPALRALGGGWRARVRRGSMRTLFLRLWVVFVLVFFSLSDSKLIPYILPALPALALLAAGVARGGFERDVARTALMTLGVAIVLGLACLVAPAHLAPSERNAYFLALAKPLAQVAALLAASGPVCACRSAGAA